MFFLLAVLSLIVILWWYLDHLLHYWERKEVPFVKSSVWTQVRSQFYDPVPVVDRYKAIYNALSGDNYGGCFRNFRPQFVVRDPDLIQQILLVDFDNFRDRGSVLYDEKEPLTQHLFSAPANLWRKLRIRLTPTFTSGKMKYMFDLVKECAEEYQQILLKAATTSEPFDVKDYSVNYTIEVISSTAFGLKTHSMTSDSEFKEMSRRIFRPSLRMILKVAINNWCPSLKNLFPTVTFFDKRVNDFFFRTIRETVTYRKMNRFARNDFLQILMSLNETSTKSNTDGHGEVSKELEEKELVFTNELMTAQCFLFFVAGFDTSSLVLSATMLELAVNRHIQDKLHDEIDRYLELHDNKISYEMIQAMPYLHKVVQESMRKYPVLPFLSRKPSKAYRVPGSNITLDEGTEIIISIHGLHHDPEYYPDPEKFDPERFTDEEISARNNFVYLPFGGGPRNCIGSRFGLISVKLGVVHLLQKYNFDTTAETIYPIKYKPFKTINDCAHELLLRCSLRTSS